jgi:hypothetical protein
MKKRLPNSLSIKKTLLATLLIVAFFGKVNAAYFWQVQSIASLAGSATYSQFAPANPLVLNIQQCAGGSSLPHNSTVYNQTLYVNTLNSTVGGTVVSSNVIGTPANFAPSYSYTPSTSTVGTLYYYYMLTSPSMTTCGFTGTLTSPIATITVAGPGEALDFDGANDYVNLGNGINSVIDPINKFTAEAWVLPSSTVSPTFDAIVGNYNTSTGGMQFLLRQSGNKYEFFVDAGSGFVGVGSAAATVSLSVWQHVAGTWDGSMLKLYLNGVLSATNTAIGTSFITHPNPVWIGGQSLNSEYFQGGLDEVRLWTRALCQGEIQNNMNGEIPTTASGLLANYHFNQGMAAQPNPTVTTLTDASGNAYTGTLTNMALTGTTSNWIAPGAVTGTAPAFVPPTITVNSGSICSGNSFTMTPSGATSYTYEGGNAVVSPTASTNYTVAGSTLGCMSNIVTSSLTVNTLPTISVNSGAICSGSSFTMVPSGASTYTYSSGSAVVSPTANASYTVTGTDANGCDGNAVSNVTVNTCSAAEALDFDGTSDYVDLGTAITTSLVNKDKLTVEAWVYPKSNTGVHSIVGNHQGPTQFELRTNANNFNFFIGFGSFGVTSVATLTLNTWTHVAGVFDQNKISIYVNGVASGTTAVTSFSFPASSVSAKIGLDAFSSYFNGSVDEVRIWDRALCQGEIVNNMNGEIPTSSTGLMANYHFNQGIAAQPNPTVTTLMDASGNANTGTLLGFALTGTTSNWIAPGAVTGTAPAFVPPTITVNSGSICSGNSFTMTPSGATSYTYEGGNAVVSPTASTNYTVAGSTLGCMSNIVTSSLTVNTLPIITVNSGSICSGNSFTMTPSGASTYTYSSGSAVVSPTATASYSVDGTDANGCVSAASAVSNVTVNALPIITVNSGSICSGSSFTMTPSGASTYTYSSGSAVVSPAATASYSVDGTDANGCVSAASAVSNVTVNALPTINASTSSTIICTLPTQQTATLTATGATTYTWSTSTSGSTIAVSPSVTASYTVTGTDANGCENTAIITQSVSTCAGITEYISGSGVSVYPNPNNGIFTVYIQNATNTTTISVINVLGQVVLNKQAAEEKTLLNLQELENGIYFININNGLSKQTIKIVKQ